MPEQQPESLDEPQTEVVETVQPEASTGKQGQRKSPRLSLFEVAYGNVNAAPGKLRTDEWPMPPASAPHRPKGSIGPVAPTTLGFHRQYGAMLISSSEFASDLALERKMHGGMPLSRGDAFVGPLGHVTNLKGERV